MKWNLNRFLLPAVVGLGLVISNAIEASAAEIIAHRGASAYEPENTLRAVNRAWEMGADATEVDVYLTKDNRIVAMHDRTIKRTTNGDGPVSAHTLEELKKLRIRWQDKLLEDEQIPLLEEILATIPEGKRIFIEIKTGPEIVPALKEMLDASPLERDQLVIITFNYDTIVASKKALPALKHYYLSDGKKETIEEVIAKTKSSNADGINLSHAFPVTKEVVEKAKAAGYDTYVWTIREEQAELSAKLVDIGVVGLTTDFPDVIRDWVKGNK